MYKMKTSYEDEIDKTKLSETHAGCIFYVPAAFGFILCKQG